MKHQFKILTRRREGQSHRETKVTIDWAGISREDLMTLAKNALVNDLQARIQKSTGPFPEEVTLVARELVHHEPEALMQYRPVEKKVAIDKELEKLLKKLHPDELKLLLGN